MKLIKLNAHNIKNEQGEDGNTKITLMPAEPAYINPNRIVAMKQEKKDENSSMTIILLAGITEPLIVSETPEEVNELIYGS